MPSWSPPCSLHLTPWVTALQSRLRIFFNVSFAPEDTVKQSRHLRKTNYHSKVGGEAHTAIPEAYHSTQSLAEHLILICLNGLCQMIIYTIPRRQSTHSLSNARFLQGTYSFRNTSCCRSARGTPKAVKILSMLMEGWIRLSKHCFRALLYYCRSF